MGHPVGFQAGRPGKGLARVPVARDIITPVDELELHSAILECGMDPHNTACGLVHLRLIEVVNGELRLGQLARKLLGL